MTPDPPTLTAASIAEHVGGELIGPADTPVQGVNDFNLAGQYELVLIGNQRYADQWAGCPAAVALVKRGLDADALPGKSLIRIDNADLAFNKAMDLFAPPPIHTEPGTHPSAVVHESAAIGKDVHIGPNCYIGPGVRLGDRCVLYGRVTILDHTSVGSHCTFWPGVVIRDRCEIGDRCSIHPNAVIGADGFGYRPEITENGPRLVKTPQIGTVFIGNDVEIGANTCIDRAKCSQTVIGDGCKIDNLVQIGHNCRLGQMVIISGCTGVGGSTVIGDGTMIGGHVAITDHVVIGKGVQLAGGSQLAGDIPDGSIYAGSPARPFKDAIREVHALKRLPRLLKEWRRR